MYKTVENISSFRTVHANILKEKRFYTVTHVAYLPRYARDNVVVTSSLSLKIYFTLNILCTYASDSHMYIETNISWKICSLWIFYVPYVIRIGYIKCIYITILYFIYLFVPSVINVCMCYQNIVKLKRTNYWCL